MDRTPEQEQRVKSLLSQLTGEILATPEGKVIRASGILNAQEEEALRNLPVLSDEPPGFDGETCDMCRGFTRLTNCKKCYGSFEVIQRTPEYAEKQRK